MRPRTILLGGLLIGFIWFWFTSNHSKSIQQEQHEQVERLILNFEA